MNTKKNINKNKQLKTKLPPLDFFSFKCNCQNGSTDEFKITDNKCYCRHCGVRLIDAELFLKGNIS